jgi:hypothetical protein
VQRYICGLGSVWQQEHYDDAVGVFRWVLAVNQIDDSNLKYLLQTNEAYGGYDGNQSFTAEIQNNSMDWADDPGTGTQVPGQYVEVACVSHAGGSNAEWTISAETDKMGVTFKYGNPDRLIKWEVRVFVAATSGGCPSISLINNQASVSDSNYYWGDYIPKGIDGSSIGESDINRQLPQIAITPPDCFPFNTENYMTVTRIPLNTDPTETVENVTFDVATEI